MSIDWQPPSELPDLRRVGELALDTEPKDDGLQADRGSGWPWHGGYICGVSIAYRTDNGIRPHYFPIRHPDSKNFDPAQLFAWLKDLAASDVRIITKNGLYDWGWLYADAGLEMLSPSAWKRSMRSPPWRTKPAGNTVLMRYAPGAAFLAKTRHCCTKDVLHSG